MYGTIKITTTVKSQKYAGLLISGCWMIYNFVFGQVARRCLHQILIRFPKIREHYTLFAQTVCVVHAAVVLVTKWQYVTFLA